MTITGEFRRRAFHEARRYGGDSWVFVRELLQNSRDAGAGQVDLLVEQLDGIDRIICRDDGCGMSFDHARRYLFTLYASSKTGAGDTAGRFGIGFWAVLRFDPDEVIVRSAPEDEPGWQLAMSGDLEEIQRSGSSLRRGTEIELSRKTRGEDPVAAVWDAVVRDASHLRTGDGEILDVRVNSRRATTEITLDAPSLTFARSGLNGAVALADRPQVDLLAHGLRVRTTATLGELLTRPERRRRRASGTPEGLVPRVILDSRRLQVLMARGDARTDRELRRLVAMGRRGVRRLVRGELDRGAGLGWFRRAGMRCLEVVRLRRSCWIAFGLVVAAVFSLGAWWLTNRGSDRMTGAEHQPPKTRIQVPRRPDSILRSEVVRRYRGPAADTLDELPATIGLRYRPSASGPLLSVFRVVNLGDDGRVVRPAPGEERRPYLGAACAASCLDITLDLLGGVGSVRLPVPTGHLLDPASLRLEDGTGELLAAQDGGPLLTTSEGFSGRVRYRTGPGFESLPVVQGSWPVLPDAADDVATRLRSEAPDEAAEAARDWVRRHVAYDTSQATVDRHRAAARAELPFAERCLAVGAGDCDVQNALLAAILARAGISVRLAVGFVGSGGRALPGLHAWVEYRGAGGAWRAIDASEGAGSRVARQRPASAVPADRGEMAHEEPGQTESGESSSAAVPGRVLGAIALILGLAVVGMVWVSRRRWTVSHDPRGGDADLAELLRGALARPEAYREVPALFARRVVPVLGPSTISLDRARSLSRRGRLVVSDGSSDLARAAAARGRPVIDGSRSEGTAVASTLGAIDLDRWDGIMHLGGEHPITERLEKAAAAVGEVWTVMVGSGLADDVVILDERFAGGRHVVVVDRESSLWTRVVEHAAGQGSLALFLLADRVVERLTISPMRKRRLLSGLAAEAVVKRAEAPS